MSDKSLPLLQAGQYLGGAKKKDAKGVQYVVEKIDGMPNADLVIKYKNGKKVGQKVVNLDKLKTVSSESIAPHSDKKQKKTKIVYVKTPQNAQPVVVQKEAGFGTYLMQGFGLGLGLDAAGALFDGIDDAYDDGGDW
jgi:hypothetical protein